MLLEVDLKNIPKYIQLKNYIKQTIKNKDLKPGERIHSENELSQKFNISRHTVRQSIGGLVNEGWLYRVHGKGTFVARAPGLQKEKSRIAGVMTTYLNDYIFPDIIKGIDSVLSLRGYSMMLANTQNNIQNERKCLLNLLDNNIDGLIVEPTKSALPNPNLDLYREMSAQGIPIIFIHAYYNELNFSYVIEDDIRGGYIAARHLIELGHRKIFGIFKIDDIQGHKRYQGFIECMKEFNLHTEDEAVVWFCTEDRDKIFKNEIYMKNIINRLKHYTAVICYNDQISIQLINVLRKKNIKIPADLSLVSFDDSDICKIAEVNLTSVAHPKESLGQKAANSLLKLLNNTEIHIEEIMKPELITRESSNKFFNKN